MQQISFDEFKLTSLLGKTMERLQLFQNLVLLAASDGKFTEEEVQALAVRAEDWNISDEEFQSILVGLETGEVDMHLPEKRESRFELLSEMVRVMAADGDLAEVEKHLCATAAVRMDISIQEFEELVNSLL